MRPRESGTCRWQQRSSSATGVPSSVRHRTTGSLRRVRPRGADRVTSFAQAAMYQAFRTKRDLPSDLSAVFMTSLADGRSSWNRGDADVAIEVPRRSGKAGCRSRPRIRATGRGERSRLSRRCKGGGRQPAGRRRIMTVSRDVNTVSPCWFETAKSQVARPRSGRVRDSLLATHVTSSESSSPARTGCRKF